MSYISQGYSNFNCSITKHVITSTDELIKLSDIVKSNSEGGEIPYFTLTIVKNELEEKDTILSELTLPKAVALINKKKLNMYFSLKDELRVPFFCYNAKTNKYEYYDSYIFRKWVFDPITTKEGFNLNDATRSEEFNTHSFRLAAKFNFNSNHKDHIQSQYTNYKDHFGNLMFITFEDNDFYYFIISLSYIISLRKDEAHISGSAIMYNDNTPDDIKRIADDLDHYRRRFNKDVQGDE